MRDSFGQGQADKELDEVQYGDQRVIVQSGRAAYLAVVTTGIEPEGFRARLRGLASDLHVKYERLLRDYTGDSSTLPNLQPRLMRLVAETAFMQQAGPKPMTRAQRVILVGGSLMGLLLLAMGCFYLRFTIALLPVAFPSSTPTVTRTPTVTSTPTNTPTPTATFTPSVTPTPVEAEASGHVWVFREPSEDSPKFAILVRDTPVTMLETKGVWIHVEWYDTLPWLFGWQRGWVPARWVSVLLVMTPTP